MRAHTLNPNSFKRKLHHFLLTHTLRCGSIIQNFIYNANCALENDEECIFLLKPHKDCNELFSPLKRHCIWIAL